MAYLEKAAGQGHAYAMGMLSEMLFMMNDEVRAVEWLTKGAEAGLPSAMFNLGCSFDKGQGVAAPDYPSAAGWYKLAADAGDASAAVNLSSMYLVGRGRVWQLTPVASSATFHTLVLELNRITRRGEQYLPGPRARRDAQ